MGLRGPKRRPKHCPDCGTTDLTAFGPNTSHYDGLQVYCRACHGFHLGKDRNRNWRWQRYTLTADQFDALLIQQKNLCAICHLPLGAHPVIDHDHTCCNDSRSCGRCIRGLVHQRCNVLLGLANENIAVLQGAIEYLQNWKKPTF